MMRLRRLQFDGTSKPQNVQDIDTLGVITNQLDTALFHHECKVLLADCQLCRLEVWSKCCIQTSHHWLERLTFFVVVSSYIEQSILLEDGEPCPLDEGKWGHSAAKQVHSHTFLLFE